MNDNLLGSDDQLDSKKNFLEELVGEGKKFKTVEDLAKGKYEADVYIAAKNKAFDDLREDYLKLRDEHTAGATLQDLIDQLSEKQLGNSTMNNPQATEVIQQPSYDPKQIESLVSAKIQEHELTKKQQANFNSVRDRLIKQFGENYQTHVKNQIEDLDMSEDMFNSLARNNPKLVYKTLGLEETGQRETFQAPERSAQNSVPVKGAPKRTWSYYQELKKTNPHIYLDQKTQIQMAKDYETLGNEFEDGDFHRY